MAVTRRWSIRSWRTPGSATGAANAPARSSNRSIRTRSTSIRSRCWPRPSGRPVRRAKWKVGSKLEVAAERLTDEQTLLVVEFARACRSAARSVALYPSTHPTIRAALARIVGAAARLTATGDLTLTITPEALTVNGREVTSPDCAIVELAQLL